MKILVTGATGYFGNRLALTLAEAGNTVHILVRNVQSPNLPVHDNIKVFAGDITDPLAISKAIVDCEQIYHTAALVKFYNKNSSEIFKINVAGTHNILIAARQAGVSKLVFTSTCGVYGPSLNGETAEDGPEPTNFLTDYDLSKFMAEKLVAKYTDNGLETVIINLPKIFGPGPETHPMSVNRVIKNFISGALCVYPVPSELICSYVFIEDAIKGHLLAMQKGSNGEKYIIGGENLSYSNFFKTLREVSHIKGKIMAVPKYIATIIGFLNFLKGLLTGKEPFFTNKEVSLAYCMKAFSSAKAIRQLGYKITPFSEAVRQTINFIKNQ